jgi:hypothetical protein
MNCLYGFEWIDEPKPMNKKISTEQSKKNLLKPMPVPNKTHFAEQTLKTRSAFTVHPEKKKSSQS